MLGTRSLAAATAEAPAQLANLGSDDWHRLLALYAGGSYGPEFERGFDNGRFFLSAKDALAGRTPRIIEWTGGRNPPGDEVIPCDLRVDHVYLVSCKYQSRILHNGSPARIFDGLLSAVRTPRTDWYLVSAPNEYQQLYEICRQTVGAGAPMPADVADLDPRARRSLATSLASGWPGNAAAAYAALCSKVSESTAARWSASLSPAKRETMLWRLLRIGAAPYFILGTDSRGSMRFRIDTPWDWRQAFRLKEFTVSPMTGGQPLVSWSARYVVNATNEERLVAGHVEIRWSHGRFTHPPEAKVYLDTPHAGVPGYHLL